MCVPGGGDPRPFSGAGTAARYAVHGLQTLSITGEVSAAAASGEKRMGGCGYHISARITLSANKALHPDSHPLLRRLIVIHAYTVTTQKCCLHLPFLGRLFRNKEIIHEIFE